jgi:hypothetical protein
MHYSVSFASPIPHKSGVTSFDVTWFGLYCDRDELTHNLPLDFKVLGVAENVTHHVCLEYNPFVYHGGSTQVLFSFPGPEVIIQGIDTPYMNAGYIAWVPYRCWSQ